MNHFFLCLQLPNHLFEELVMDIYDEVDRRETEASKYIHLHKLILALSYTVDFFIDLYRVDFFL